MTEARDALAVAPLGPLVEEARANHVRWQHEAEYLEECGRELCIGAKLLLWPDIEDPRDSFPLPDGWVLARREDAEDGAALRELREARAGKPVALLLNNGVWSVHAGVLPSPTDPSLAAAARKAKEALG